MGAPPSSFSSSSFAPAVPHSQSVAVRMLQVVRPSGTTVAGPVGMCPPVRLRVRQHGQAAGAGGMSRLKCRFNSAPAGSLGFKHGSRSAHGLGVSAPVFGCCFPLS